MKYYLSLIAAAALSLSACSQEAPKPAESAPAAEAASAPAAAETPAPASEAAPAADTAAALPDSECQAVVETDDNMKYSTNEIAVRKGCKHFTITLKHKGSKPSAVMGHNIVITKAADKSAVAADGASAKQENDYVPADDDRVLAHTKLIGGGEEASLKLDVAKLSADGDYDFFCSFPGHANQMSGKVKLVD